MSAGSNVAHHPSEGRPTDGATPLDQSATAAAIEVRTVPTPNPNALMFRVDETLVPTGTFEYHTLDEAKSSPLAQVLLRIEGVDVVLVAPRFVTVTKKIDTPWPDVVPPVKDRIRAFLLTGEMAVLDDASTEPAPERGELEQRIIQLIDDENPTGDRDGRRRHHVHGVRRRDRPSPAHRCLRELPELDDHAEDGDRADAVRGSARGPRSRAGVLSPAGP